VGTDIHSDCSCLLVYIYPQRKRRIALLATSGADGAWPAAGGKQSNAEKRQYALWNLQTTVVLPLVWKHLQTTERDGQRRFLLSCLQTGFTSSLQKIHCLEVTAKEGPPKSKVAEP